jgi:hypothetical protein
MAVIYRTGSSRKCNRKISLRRYVFSALDILAGIQSVIYGVWGSLLIVPLIPEKLAPHFVEFSTGYTILDGGNIAAVGILPVEQSGTGSAGQSIRRRFGIDVDCSNIKQLGEIYYKSFLKKQTEMILFKFSQFHQIHLFWNFVSYLEHRQNIQSI